MHLRTYCAIEILAALAKKRENDNEFTDAQMVGDAVTLTEVLLDTLGENPSQNVYPASAPLGNRSSSGGGRSRDEGSRKRRGGGGRGGGRGGSREAYWGEMTSNYEGECHVCGNYYEEGDKIMYHAGQPKGKKALHPECWDKEHGEEGN